MESHSLSLQQATIPPNPSSTVMMISTLRKFFYLRQRLLERSLFIKIIRQCFRVPTLQSPFSEIILILFKIKVRISFSFALTDTFFQRGVNTSNFASTLFLPAGKERSFQPSRFHGLWIQIFLQAVCFPIATMPQEKKYAMIWQWRMWKIRKKCYLTAKDYFKYCNKKNFRE